MGREFGCQNGWASIITLRLHYNLGFVIVQLLVCPSARTVLGVGFAAVMEDRLMLLQDFIAKVDAHEELTGVGVLPDLSNGVVVVSHKTSGLTSKIPVADIEELEWELLYDLISGKREPIALRQMTRVVGYYSRVENWNQSKLGELKDRRKGSYIVAADDSDS